MTAIDNFVYDGRGGVWGLYRVPWDIFSPGHGKQRAAELLTALGRLGCGAKLSWGACSHGPPGPAAPILSLEVSVKGAGRISAGRAGARAVAGAAGATVLRRFGLGSAQPGRRLAAIQRAAADRLVAGLASFRLTEPTAGEVESALRGGLCRWREVRSCGYLIQASPPPAASRPGGTCRGDAGDRPGRARLPAGDGSGDIPPGNHGGDGRPAYRACFVTLPRAGCWDRWPVQAPELPPAVWTVCVRPVRSGLVVALLARCEAGNLVDLGERAGDLRRAAAARGWELVRPGSGQALLNVAMAPGPTGHRRRLPGRVFFPLVTPVAAREAFRDVDHTAPVPIPPSVRTEGQT